MMTLVNDDSTRNNLPLLPAITTIDEGDIVTAPESEFRILRLSSVFPSSLNPRKHFDDAGITTLAESIRAVGITTPIMVRPLPADGFGDAFEIIMGERRYRAAEEAGLLEIPAILRNNVSDADLLGLAITENIKRADLTALEEATAYHEALRLEPTLTQKSLGERFGIAQSTIANALRLLQLPEAVRLQIERAELSRSHGVALASLSDQPETCVRFALQSAKEGWPVSQLETAIRAYKDAQEVARQPKLMESEPKPVRAINADEKRRDILGRLMSMDDGVIVNASEIEGQDSYVQELWEIYQAGVRGDVPQWGKPCRFFIHVGPDALVHRVDYDPRKASVAEHCILRGPTNGVSETGYRSVYFTRSDKYESLIAQIIAEANAIYAETAWGKKRLKEAAKESPDSEPVSTGPEQKPDGQLSTWFQWCSRAGLPGTAANWENMRGDMNAPAWAAYSEGLKPSEYAAQRGHLPSEPLPESPTETPEIVVTPPPVANPEPTLAVPAVPPLPVDTIAGVRYVIERMVDGYQHFDRDLLLKNLSHALAGLRALEAQPVSSTMALTSDSLKMLEAINIRWNAEHGEDMQTTLEERLELTVFSRAAAMGISVDDVLGEGQ